MAKMIKCPTCGTQIEVPATPSGQVIKCPGCGKGLKLVAKKKEPTPGGGIQLSASGSPINSGGSMAGGSMSGASVSAMTFQGDLPPDDMPNLDSVCQVCGRPTDFDQLTEDNGKLVCRDCIKGARSSIARPTGGAETIGFKAPEYRPTRRAKMVNVTPAFLLACFLGIIWCVCQVYLSTHPEPKGTAMASMTKPKPGSHDLGKTPTTPEPSAATAPVTSADAQATPAAPTSQVASSANNPPAVPDTQPTAPAGAPTSQAVAIAPAPGPQDGTIFNENGSKPANPGGPIIPPPVAPAIASGDPLDRGLDRLQARDYQAAIREFDAARKKYPLGAVTERMTPQQAEALDGLGAAYLGAGHPDLAEAPLNAAYARGDRSRTLALNRAICVVSMHGASLDKLGAAATDLKTYLDSHAGDEYAADVFGTLLAKAATYPKAKPEQMATLWEQLDQYNDAMSQQHDGKLKWGTEWLPPDDVKRYRLSRSAISSSGKVDLVKAAKDLETAKAKSAAAERAFDNAKTIQASGGAVDLVGAQRTLDAAKANEEKAQKTFDGAAAGTNSKPPKWLEKFDPVVPEAAPAP